MSERHRPRFGAPAFADVAQKHGQIRSARRIQTCDRQFGRELRLI